MRYFITFTCYGARVHGDESGSVDRNHNTPGSRLLAPDPHLVAVEQQQMVHAPYSLNCAERESVLQAMEEVCSTRGWTLLAAHVHTNRVHAVVEAGVRPERVMNDFKSYASRRLNRSGIDDANRKRWARHGSTRWLWTDQDVRDAIQYVVEGQGDHAMAVLVHKDAR